MVQIFDNFLAKSEGRLEPDEAHLVKSPLVMGVFKLPASVCDELNHLIRNYFVGGF
jgi:hypothetical protein